MDKERSKIWAIESEAEPWLQMEMMGVCRRHMEKNASVMIKFPAFNPQWEVK